MIADVDVADAVGVMLMMFMLLMLGNFADIGGVADGNVADVDVDDVDVADVADDV